MAALRTPSFATTAPAPTLPRPAGGLSHWAAGHPPAEEWVPSRNHRRGAVLDESDGLVEPAARLAIAALDFTTMPPISAVGYTPLRFVGLGGLLDACHCRLRRPCAYVTALSKRPASGVSAATALDTVAARTTKAARTAKTALTAKVAENTCAYVLADPLAAMLHRLHGCADVVLVLTATTYGPRFHYARPAPAFAGAGLTAREADVLACLLARWCDIEIATALVISAATVRSHCRTVYRKLGVANRAQLRAALGV